MTTIIVQLNFNLSDAEYCLFVTNLYNILVPDISDIAEIVLNAPKITEFRLWEMYYEVDIIRQFLFNNLFYLVQPDKVR